MKEREAIERKEESYPPKQVEGLRLCKREGMRVFHFSFLFLCFLSFL